MINLELFQQIVLELPDGVVVSDATQADFPVVYVNPAFEKLTGYSAEEALGKNCRFLQRPEGQEKEKAMLHQALTEGRPCTVTLQNYRKDGSMFWNELSVSPIHNAEGKTTHIIGLLKDISRRIQLETQLQVEKQSLEEANRKLEQLVIHDDLTGVYNRMFFDSQLLLQWKTAARNKDALALLLIDIEHFSKINTKYGHENGNRILKNVAEGLRNTFTRSSDFVVRYGGDEFVVLAASIDNSQARDYARELEEKIRNLSIPPVYTELGYVMINLRVGVAVHAPQPDENPELLLSKAVKALNNPF
ncbi:MAG TPA: diguanylate cyclase [Methylophilaceae bacterium]|nr:diguanylate cyclase [Methylophilaceae bacterium]